MKIRLMCLHRHENYAGEYAPEVVGVVDEYTNDENPDYWRDEKARMKKTYGSEGKLAEVEIEVESQDILSAIHKIPTARVGELRVVKDD